MYSLKELTKKDFIGTLAKVSEAGYDGVEFAGYFDTPSGELKKTLDNLGLKPAGSHIGIDRLVNNLDEVIEYSLGINDPYIICPGIPEHMRDSRDAYLKTAELFNGIGSKCRASGIAFGYHNHGVEFDSFDGQYGFDILFQNTDSNLVLIELDTYWVEYRGLKSIDFMEKYGERCRLLHIKDMKDAPEKGNTEIGKGTMDFKEIVKKGKVLKTDWYTVEQEEFDIPEIQSIKESIAYLRQIL